MERTKTQLPAPKNNGFLWLKGILSSFAFLFLVFAVLVFLPFPQPAAVSQKFPPGSPTSPAARPTYTPTPAPTRSPTLPPTDTVPSPSSTPTATSLPPTSTPPNPQIIGTSTAGRPLEVYRYGSGASSRLIIAGIHGGYEWNTIALAEVLQAHIKEHPDFIPPEVTLYILPALNPDGVARARGIHGRANQNGVDLNRNFPTLWQKNWPLAGCWSYLPISAGSGPASEVETQALIKFIEGHEFDALISYHSAALGIFPGGQPPDPASVSLAETVAHVSSYPYPPHDLGCTYTGQLIDWTAQQGIPSLDIELSNHQDTDLEQNLAIITAFLNWQP